MLLVNTVSISIVLYKPNKQVFISALESLVVAVEKLNEKVLLIILDNSVETGSENFEQLAQTIWTDPLKFIHSPKNLGYAKGHNKAIEESHCEYHLILNPDVILDPYALIFALDYLKKNMEVVLVSPYACSEDGNRQYLCKSYPSVFALFLRGFSPLWCQNFFSKQLADYELKGKTEKQEFLDVPIASGCFMFLRKQSFDAVGGFSENFFLYFEDFDLSIKLRQLGKLAYVPKVKIVHFGGQAARKGTDHILLFGRSMCSFFNKHGWCLY